jgi:hypothetical protein
MGSRGTVPIGVVRVWTLVVLSSASCVSAPTEDLNDTREGGLPAVAATSAALTVLDEVSVAPIAAYSVALKLRASHTGAALRLRRAADNAEQDVGFTSADVVNTSAIAAFCGTNDCFATRVYDQSGNSRDLIQSNQSLQIQFYEGDTQTVTTAARIPVLSVSSNSSYRELTGNYTAGLTGNPSLTIAYQGRYRGLGTAGGLSQDAQFFSALQSGAPVRNLSGTTERHGAGRSLMERHGAGRSLIVDLFGGPP